MRCFYCAFFVILSLQLSAQTGKYDLNLEFSHVDCDNAELYVNIQIRAHDGECIFHVSDQNYRLLFNNTLISESAFIEKELEISGYIPSSTGHSLYQPHTLTGSQDNIVSYNIEFTSGEGFLVDSETWTNVGQIGFEIADITGTANVIFLDENMFPPTFIGEFYNETRLAATAGTFEALEIDLQDYCSIGEPPNDDPPVNVINTELENSISLFPTLANNYIYLNCGDNVCGDLGIIDIQGRIIRQWQGGQNTTSINHLDISALPSGTYFLRININEYYLTRRFIKE